MTEIKIADKPTLDKVKTDTERIMELINSGSLGGGAPFGFSVEIPKVADSLELLPNNLSVDSTSSAAVINGEIYAVGSDVAPFNQTSKFVPSTELWTALAPCPSGARKSKSVELNGEIYTLGGQSLVADSYTATDPVTTPHCTLCGGGCDDEEKHERHFKEVVEVYTEEDGKIIETKEEQTLERNTAFIDWATTGEYNLHLRKYNPATDTWTMLAESPTGCRCVSFSAFRGKLYIVGGEEFNIYEYDPLTNVWSEVGKIPPMNRANWGAHLIGTAYYLVYTPLNATRGSVLRYNIVQGGTQKVRYMPEAEYVTTFSSSAVYNGELYIFGAGGLLHSYQKTLKFNPATERWVELADRAFSAEDSCAVAFGDDIYVFGGQWSPFTQATKYTPATNTWVTLTNAPFAMRHSSVVLVGSEIFAIGQFGSFARYDPATDTWNTLTGAPSDLNHTSTVIHNGELYVFGTGREPANALRKYNPATNEWTDLANSPDDIFRAKAVAVGHLIVVFGGSRIGFRQKVRVYNATENIWNGLPDMPELTDFLQGVAEMADNNLFVFQGTNALRRNMETGDWVRLTDPPAAITTEAIARPISHPHFLFLFGDIFRLYNIDTGAWSVMADPLFNAREADCAAIGNGVYVLGGGTNFQKYIIWSGWLQLSGLPNGHLTGTAVAEKSGILYFIGSENPPHNNSCAMTLKPKHGNGCRIARLMQGAAHWRSLKTCRNRCRI